MSQRERRAKLRADGRCGCGRPRMIGFEECEPCRASEKRRREDRYLRGICRRCERPARVDRTTCAVCAYWMGVKARERKAALPPLPTAPAAPYGAVGSQPWGVLPAKPPGKNRPTPEK